MSSSAEIQRLQQLIALTNPTEVFHKATGVAALASTLAPAVAFQIIEIRIHLSAAGGAVGAVGFTGTLDSATNAAYDYQLFSEDMTLLTDFVYQPSQPLYFEAGDEIDFAYANGSTRTYGLTVVYTTL